MREQWSLWFPDNFIRPCLTHKPALHKNAQMFAYLYPEFQTAITGRILVQLLENKDFITPQEAGYPKMY